MTTRELAAEWALRCAVPVADGPDGEDALQVIEMFCDDAEGSAEFILERTFTEDADLMWAAAVVWDGDNPDASDEVALGSQDPVVAVYRAIQRWCGRQALADQKGATFGATG